MFFRENAELNMTSLVMPGQLSMVRNAYAMVNFGRKTKLQSLCGVRKKAHRARRLLYHSGVGGVYPLLRVFLMVREGTEGVGVPLFLCDVTNGSHSGLIDSSTD